MSDDIDGLLAEADRASVIGCKAKPEDAQQLIVRLAAALRATRADAGFLQKVIEGERRRAERAERERDEARYHYELAASQRDAARAALRPFANIKIKDIGDPLLIEHVKRARRALGEEP